MKDSDLILVSMLIIIANVFNLFVAPEPWVVFASALLIIIWAAICIDVINRRGEER